MCLSGNLVKVDRNLLFYAYQPLSGITRRPSGIILFWKFFVLKITFVRSGLCIPNMVYLVQFVCLSDGVNLKVVATFIAEINRLVHHDVQNSMPLPICGGGDLGYNSLPSCMGKHMLYLGELAAVFRGCHRQPLYCFHFNFRCVTLVQYIYIYIYIYIIRVPMHNRNNEFILR